MEDTIMGYMGGCQNYGPFLGTLNIRCRTIIGIQKGTIILPIPHVCLGLKFLRVQGSGGNIITQNPNPEPASQAYVKVYGTQFQ